MRIVFLAVALALILSCCALADDIVTMPTANQLKMGEMDVAAYYLNLSFPKPAPQFVQYQTIYVGLTNRIELDIHRAAIDNDETSTLLVGSFKLMSETLVTPDVVVGCRNITGTATTFDNPFTPIDEREKSEKQSFFACAAKTIFFNPLKPGPPLVRVHLGVGTEDWTLLGQKRHEGVFGGLQFLLTPTLGAVVENDGQDLITGITIMPPKSGLTIKGGTYGDHQWYGVAWRHQFLGL